MGSYPTSYRRPGPQRLGGRAAALAANALGLGGRLPAAGQWYLPARAMAMRLPKPPVVAAVLAAASLLTPYRERPITGDVAGVMTNYPAFGYILQASCASPLGAIHERRQTNCGGLGAPPSPAIIANTNGCLAGQGNVPRCVLGQFNGSFLISGVYDIGLGLQQQNLEYWWRPLATYPAIALPAPVRAVPMTAVPSWVPPRPIRISYVNLLVAAPTWPEQSDRGWRTPRPGGMPIGAMPFIAAGPPLEDGRNARTRFAAPPAIPDVRTFPPDVETKTTNRAFVSMMKSLSLMGVANNAARAIWRTLPPHMRTKNARTHDVYNDLSRNIAHANVPEALAGLTVVATNALGGAVLFGTATKALTQGFGENAGFGLYRAWATGERAYTTNPRGYDPRRTSDFDVGNSTRQSPERRLARGTHRLSGQAAATRRALALYNRTRRTRSPAERKAKLRRALQRIDRKYDVRTWRR